MEGDDYSHFHQYRLQESLKDLKRSLAHIGIPLLMRYGKVDDVMERISMYYDIEGVYAHEETGNHISYMRDIRVA
jgi:deoxyribodipyrimidine photo-lyase